jgi:hypothetical protein
MTKGLSLSLSRVSSPGISGTDSTNWSNRNLIRLAPRSSKILANSLAGGKSQCSVPPKPSIVWNSFDPLIVTFTAAWGDGVLVFPYLGPQPETQIKMRQMTGIFGARFLCLLIYPWLMGRSFLPETDLNLAAPLTGSLFFLRGASSFPKISIRAPYPHKAMVFPAAHGCQGLQQGDDRRPQAMGGSRLPPDVVDCAPIGLVHLCAT